MFGFKTRVRGELDYGSNGEEGFTLNIVEEEPDIRISVANAPWGIMDSRLSQTDLQRKMWITQPLLVDF